MLAAVFHGARDIRLTDLPVPRPQPHEILIKVQRAGICGSDVNRFTKGSFPWPPGFIMGHEFCGEIAALGAAVNEWQVGEQVVIEPTLYCGTCYYCQQGIHNRCVELSQRGLTGSGTDGGFAQYVCVPAYQPHRRPAHLPLELASLVEPAAVSVHGWRLANMQQADCVVVVGIGNIGLLAILVARAFGAQDIIAIGKYAPRQELARHYGASLVLEPQDPALQSRILARSNGLGADLVIEAAGSPGSLKTAVDVARKGGKIVILGVFHQDVALDYRSILMMEKQLIGSVIYQRHDFAEAMHIVAQGHIDLSRHITAELPLSDIVSHGFIPLCENKAAHIKIQIHPND